MVPLPAPTMFPLAVPELGTIPSGVLCNGVKLKLPEELAWIGVGAWIGVTEGAGGLVMGKAYDSLSRARGVGVASGRGVESGDEEAS